MIDKFSPYKINIKINPSLFNINFISAWFLVTFSCFHLSHHNLNIPPILQFSFLLTSLPSLLLLCKFKNLKFPCPKITFPAIITATLFIAYLVIELFTTNSLINPVILIIISLLYFLGGILTLKNLSYSNLMKIAISFLNITFSLFTFDTIYRFFNPCYILENSNGTPIELDSFYAYKINSLIEHTSNDYGIIAAILVCFAIYLHKEHKLKNMKYYICWGTIITILSLSRASTIALLGAILILYILKPINYLYYKHFYNIKIKTLLRLLVIIVLTSLLFFGFLKLISLEDFSFVSKFKMITYLFQEYIPNIGIIKLLIGNGFDFNNAATFLGYKPHDIINTYIVFFGVIGFSLLCILHFYIYKMTKKMYIYLLLPILFYSFSENVILDRAQWLYIICVLMCYLEIKKGTILKNEK